MFSARLLFYKKIMKHPIFLSVVILAVISLSSCKQSENTITPTSKAATYYGESKPFGGDSIRSWYKTDLNGTLSSIGVSFKQSAFAMLETQPDSMFMMILPMGLNTATMWGIDHIEVDWSSAGDAPPSLYTIPHLDVHFFAVDTATQMGIAGGKDALTANMNSTYLPPDYVLDIFSEEGMGVHAYDTTGKEFHAQAFDHTLVYGYSFAKLYFIKPMVSKAYLDTKTNFSADIKQPKAFKFSGAYPTKYYIRYNSSSSEYQISIDNFVTH